MKKLLKTTALFALLILFYNASAAGWQRYLPNYGFNINSSPTTYKVMSDDYLPTKDSGVFVYSSNNIGTHDIIKLDKSGNIQWKKSINKNEAISKGSFSVQIHYNSGTGIESVLEIPNDRYVIVHNGPQIDSTINIPSFRQNTSFNNILRYFTVTDKNGNIISRKYDTHDSIQTNWNNSTFYFDSTANSYVLFELINMNRLSKKRYDTTFNLISESNTSFDTSGLGYINYLEKFNSVLLATQYGYGLDNTLAVLDLQGNLRYKINKQARDTIDFNVFLSSNSAFQNCTAPFGLTRYQNRRLTDFYFDNSNHLHLLGIRYIYLNSSDSNRSCTGNQFVLVHTEIDENGKILKLKQTNITDFIGYELTYYVLTIATILPVNNEYCNIFINKIGGNIDDYYYLKYSLSQNKIVQNKFVSNIGELKTQRLGNNNNGWQAFLRKKKSTNDNSYFIALGPNDFVLNGIIKIDSSGSINNYQIQGNVFGDLNGNCIKDTSDENMRQITIKATKDIDHPIYITSDNNGDYTIGVSENGLYSLTAQPSIRYPFYVQGNCAVQTSYVNIDSLVIDTINLNLKTIINCPFLTIDISTARLRRCPVFGIHVNPLNEFYVFYCNNGSIASPNTYIDIALDRLLAMNTSTIPYTNIGNNTFRFQIGNLDYLKCGNFSFNAIPVCDSTILGQTLCTEAHIYPDSLCFQPNYTGPITQASARCNGDSVQFKLKNIGLGNMNSIKHYIVIEDNVNRMRGNYQLPASAETFVSIKTRNGATYRIIAEQPDELPAYYGNKFATAQVEGCRPNADSTFTTGFVTQFPNYDGEPFRSVSCNPIIGSYDPNEKISFPTGYAVQHFIEKNTDIEYQINFQNTGNDTAYKVVLVDTISRFLDINTIQPGVSSHTYQFVRTDSNVVKFVFNNIKLVDSLHNEPLSHGFVKYRIQQKPNNANGTKIYNSADIYFDYNAPVVTNKTMHTIGENFITINLINAIKNPKYNIKDIKVFPNPFHDQTQIILETNELKNPVLELMDLQGKIIRTISEVNTNTFTIERNELSSGIYLFKITENKEEVASGKLVAQ